MISKKFQDDDISQRETLRRKLYESEFKQKAKR